MRYALNALLIPIAYTAVRDRRDAVRLLAVVVVSATIAALTGIASAPAGAGGRPRPAGGRCRRHTRDGHGRRRQRAGRGAGHRHVPRRRLRRQPPHRGALARGLHRGERGLPAGHPALALARRPARPRWGVDRRRDRRRPLAAPGRRRRRGGRGRGRGVLRAVRLAAGPRARDPRRRRDRPRGPVGGRRPPGRGAPRPRGGHRPVPDRVGALPAAARRHPARRLHPHQAQGGAQHLPQRAGRGADHRRCDVRGDPPVLAGLHVARGPGAARRRRRAPRAARARPAGRRRRLPRHLPVHLRELLQVVLGHPRAGPGAAGRRARRDPAPGPRPPVTPHRPGAVVHVTMWNSPYLGNFMASELALARVVRERFGLGTHLVLGPGGAAEPWTADLTVEGVTFSELPPGLRAGRAHLDGVLAEHDARLVHSHFTSGDLPAAGAARAAGVPCVWHVHTGLLGYPPRKRLTDLYKIRVVARRSVDRVVVVAPWLADLAARRGIPRAAIELVPNALVLERFAELPDQATARQALGLPADGPVALAFGWWPHVKGVDVLLDALGALDAQGRPLSTRLVGEEQTRAFVAEHLAGAEPPWLQQSGFVTDPAALFAAADLFVSASRHEGQSYAVGEALACGLPVVASDIPGNRYYETAPDLRRFASEDAGALARELAAVAARPAAERERRRAATRAWAAEHLGVDRWCDRVAGIYAELLA